MTYVGHFKNGVVVFDAPPALPEGAAVEVAPIVPPVPPQDDSAPPTWGEVLKDFAGKAKGLPSDMARNHDHYIHGTRKR
jgi:hypothetical protein